MRMQGRTVLVTGGTRGIGRAIAQELIAGGNRVLIVGRQKSTVDAAVKELGALAGHACDLADPGRVDELAWKVARQHPDLDVLINNAGLQNRIDFLEEAIPGPRLQAEIATNFTAPVLLTALLLPVLAARSQAAIVNVTSALALAPKASAPVYCATKAALASFTRSLRHQVAGTSVQVLEVMPPLVNTAMAGDQGARKVEPEDVARALVRGLEQDRSEVAVGQARWLKRIHRWAPGIAARILRDT